MIRPITCVAVLLACASGYYVYALSHQVSLLDHQIEQTVHQSSLARERIRMLHAEWTVLNRPERLQSLADQYLSLESTKPSQFVSMSDLASRLPPPVGPDQVAAPAADAGPGLVAAGDGGGEGVAAAGGAGGAATGGADRLAAGSGSSPNTPAAGDRAGRDAASPAPAVALATQAPAAGAARSASGPAANRPAAPPMPRLAAVPPAPPRPERARIADAARGPAHPHARVPAAPSPPHPRYAAQRMPPPRPWTPSRPAAARLVPAGYRAPAYRSPPPAGGSMLGMAHAYAAGPLAPPAPMPMRGADPGGGG